MHVPSKRANNFNQNFRGTHFHSKAKLCSSSSSCLAGMRGTLMTWVLLIWPLITCIFLSATSPPLVHQQHRIACDSYNIPYGLCLHVFLGVFARPFFFPLSTFVFKNSAPATFPESLPWFPVKNNYFHLWATSFSWTGFLFCHIFTHKNIWKRPFLSWSQHTNKSVQTVSMQQLHDFYKVNTPV